MKKIFYLLGFLCSCLFVSAQYSLTSTSYTQDFDGLGTTSSSGVTSGNLGNINSSLEGWFFLELGSGANTTITAGNGSSGTGDTYNFGATGNANRTLGALRVGSDAFPVVNPRFGFYFTNNTGSTITALQIAYTGETWRRGFDNRSDRLDFQYSANATSLSTGIWTDVNGLDYRNPVNPLPVGSGSLLHSATISSIVLNINVVDGDNLFIRWTDLDATDNDDGMGINDFTLTVVDPTPIVFYSKPSGNLSDLSTWGDDPSGSGSAPTNFTDHFQEFNLVNRTTSTLNSNWVVSGVNSKVIVGDGTSSATLTIPSTAALTGVVDVTDQATLRLENTSIPTFGILDDGSTVNFAQSGTYTLPIGTFYNLTITNGIKTLGHGYTIVTGNMILDAVTSLYATTGGSSSTIILSGNFTLQNGAAFATSGTIPSIEMAGVGTQTLSGGMFRFWQLSTLDDDLTAQTILLDNANLTIYGTLYLYEASHVLSLNGNTLFMHFDSDFGDPLEILGSISGSNTSNIIINKINGSDIGALRMTPGAQVLGTLEYRDLASSVKLQLLSPLSLVTTFHQHINSDIYTSSANLLTLLNGATLSGPGVGNSYIIGPFARVTNAAGPYLFPVSGKLIYLDIPTSGNPSTFKIQYFDIGIYTTEPICETVGLSGYKINEYWDIERINGTSPASISIDFDGQNIDPAEWNQNNAPSTGDGIIMAHYINGIVSGINGVTTDCWENVSNSAPILPFPQSTVTSQVLNSFSPFTFGYLDFGPPLPVKFGNVKASQLGTGIKIDWSNYTETDVVNYTIEHSTNGRDFVSLSSIIASKNDGSRADYFYLHTNPANGLNFYRIRSLETDGKKVYSVVVRVNTINNNDVTIYPNPVTTNGTLVLQTHDLKKGSYTINVLNAVGQKVFSNSLNHIGGFITQSIQLSPTLTPGLYTLQLIGNDTKINKLFIIR